MEIEMSSKNISHNTVKALAAVAIVMAAGLTQASTQGHGQHWQPLQVIEAGTRINVRTSRVIDERDQSGRVFDGVVDRDVRDGRGRLAIPRGATVELIVRRVGRGELYLDMESINVNGQRYGVDATKRSIEAGTHTDSTIGANRETAEHVGGGALIGSVIGAIVGGGKGAAIGAAAGAGVGAATQIQVHGDFVSVPAESLITFRLESPLTLGWTDTGRDRDGAHYHGDNQR
jgi:hypothetical protein